MTILRINERLQTPGQADATLTLSFQQRQKRRQRARLNSGEEVALSLPHGTRLRSGDLLHAEDGRVIEVRAAAEPVTTAYSEDPYQLARVAYHLGNRHVALQIGPGWVRYLADHVLNAMVESLGLRIVNEQQPFHPESGAYHTGGHDHQGAARQGAHEHG